MKYKTVSDEDFFRIMVILGAAILLICYWFYTDTKNYQRHQEQGEKVQAMSTLDKTPVGEWLGKVAL